jgi:hypothetical protein
MASTVMLIKHKDADHGSTGRITMIPKFSYPLSNTVGQFLKDTYNKLDNLPSSASLECFSICFGTVTLSYRMNGELDQKLSSKLPHS